MHRSARAALALIVALLPAVALAADLPTARFIGAAPAQVIETIAKGCIDRGFFLRGKTPAQVVCQASEIPNKKDGGFKPKQGDPAGPFMTFTFDARADGADTVVTESTAMFLLIRGEHGVNLDGGSGFRFKAQVRDFLREMGGEVSE